jgi:uncharacterized protein YndB with AHSA1/START domain
MENKKNDTSDREFRASRVLDAPVELVWEVWTSPEHMAQWWKPKGFTNRVDLLEMRPGGEWHMVLHGPDGTEHVVRSVFREVVPLRRIAYDVHDRASGLKFAVTVEFEAKGAKTIIDWYSLFETAGELIKMVKTLKADEGLRLTLDSLNHYFMEKVIKEYYSAWEKKDWNLIEHFLADGFTFTSPNNDDHISVRAFREKCFPEASKMIKKFYVDKVFGNGDEAFAKYQLLTLNGASFRNTEYFKFENGKIKEIEVYFGSGQAFPDKL